MPSTLGAETFVMIFMSALTSIPGVMPLLHLVVPHHQDSLFLRRLTVYSAAISVFLRIRWAMFKTRNMKDEDPRSEKIWEEAHRKNAAEMFDVGTTLEGVWIKVSESVKRGRA